MSTAFPHEQPAPPSSVGMEAARLERALALFREQQAQGAFSAGRGFLVGTPWPSFYGAWATSSCFGHAGAFCTLGFGDHDTGLAVGIVTNGNAGPGDFLRRFRPIVSALRRACVRPA